MSALDQLELIKCGDLAQKRIVFQVDVACTVGEALEAMKKHSVSSLVIVNKEKKYELVGILDIRMMMFFLAWGKYKWVPETKDAVFQASVDYAGSKVTDMLETQSEGSRAWSFSYKDPVQKAVETFSKGVHRAVVYGDDPTHRRMLTQTDVARWVASNHAFAKILDKSLKELGLVANKALIVMQESETVIDGFRKAGQNEINAVAIVDSKTGRLVGNLSASDLKGIDAQSIRSVEQPVTQYLLQHSPLSLNPVVVLPEDSLRLSLNKMLAVKVHRVWIVNGQNLNPIGVVSLTDVLSLFTAYSSFMQS